MKKNLSVTNFIKAKKREVHCDKMQPERSIGTFTVGLTLSHTSQRFDRQETWDRYLAESVLMAASR